MPALEEEYIKQEEINGVIYDMSPAADFKHGIINGNIYAVIKNALKGSICLVFMENLDYKYDADNYIIPDVMIVCDRKDLKGGSYYGTPRFVVETLSPGTAARDRGVKFDIYEEKGVEEYWIISPKEHAVEIYYLVDGKYKLENAYILESDSENRHYNADTEITLRSFPNIKMMLMDIFESVEE